MRIFLAGKNFHKDVFFCKFGIIFHPHLLSSPIKGEEMMGRNRFREEMWVREKVSVRKYEKRGE
jgi:hypothetical protein